MAEVVWDIRREGRSWSWDEVESRYFRLVPEKTEMTDGKRYWTDEERLAMLGMLLENVGVDAAVRIGTRRSGATRSLPSGSDRRETRGRARPYAAPAP